jgi:hypothetical protein
VEAGVPQGSPLSPILFILYIASLYKALKEAHPLISIAGFADDTNLLAFGKTPQANIQQLEKAWKTCLQWAATRGMAFAPQKCELIHFNKGRRQWGASVALALPGGAGTTNVAPVGSARFLGVWLDWKLSWKAHCKAVERKLKTQDYALSKIAAKTWGPALAKAREVYTKCIRSAIAYGASSFHTPTEAKGTSKPTGPAKRLAKAQNRSLRIVAGAYKSTPIRCLETETWVPPLDLYLNKRLADFEERLQKPVLQSGAGREAPKTTAGDIITEACNKLYHRFRRRKRGRGRRPKAGPQSPTATEAATATVAQWANQRWKSGEKKGRKLSTDQVVELAWQDRWQQQKKGQNQRRMADEDPPTLLFTNRALKRHQGLTKAQSSLLTQARTGDIGLRDYLFRFKVPGIATPYCSCGQGRETVEHLVVWCLDPPQQRPWKDNEIRSRRDLQTVLRGIGARSARLVRQVLSWLMDSGRLPEYSLARRLELETGVG